MQNVLVTGGAGFIGSNFVRYILAEEAQVRVVNLDALTYAGSLANLVDVSENEYHIFVEGNICDADLLGQLFDQYQFDTIVHFAAESHVDRSIHDPGLFIQTNVIGSFYLLEAARKAWLMDKKVNLDQARFLHVSTDEVFGTLTPDAPPFNENTAYAPNSPYSASKASSDHLVRAYYHTYGLPILITNCTNNYGPYQFPEKLIPLMILNALEGKPLPIYGDGMQVRDWLYVEDHCEAIYRVLSQGRIGETYAIGGDNQPPNVEIVKTTCQIMDELCPNSPFVPHQSLIQYVQDRPGHDRRYAMEITKIGQELNWKPRQSLHSGLEKTIRWYLKHPEWIEAIRKRQDYQSWVDQNYSQRGEKSK
jgi:dTDP-glucose 4,6-dehydratase